MPIILNPTNIQTTPGQLKDIASIVAGGTYDYNYPADLDLRPGQVMHDKLRDLILSKARASQDVLKRRFSGWNEIDRTLTAYIQKDTDETEIEESDSRKPTAIVVPVSYAALETLLTYMAAAFLSEEPLLRYDGVGPEDVLGAILMETAVAQQCRRAKVPLELHTMWRDGFAYGFSAGYIGYENRTAYRTISTPDTEFSSFAGKAVPTGRTTRVRETRNIFSGGTLTAIDPYMCLPDPDVPIQNVQKGEFFGWVDRTNLMTLLGQEKDNANDYFNCRYLKHTTTTSILNTRSETAREDRVGGVSDSAGSYTQPVDIVHMYIKLIPKDYGLGESEYPEKWLISLAGDSIIIKASPLGLDHDQFPVAIMAPDYDGHSITPISRLETVHELQITIDWLFKSHIANVRKAINDMLVVDPQLVNIYDLQNPKPGKLIRLRRQAWGRGVKDSVMQLPVSDVTRGHIADSGYITNIIRETVGSLDSISGIRRKTSERVSATEANQTSRGALSRLEKAAKIASLQAHYDIAWQMAYNTRQLMEDDIYAKIIGDWGTVLAKDFGFSVEKGRVAISPKSLDIDFDVIPHDGSIPNSGDPQMWIQLAQIFLSNPILAQQFDAVRMFKFGARMAGAKNLDDFIAKQPIEQNMQVMPDEQVAAQVQQGNLQPMQV